MATILASEDFTYADGTSINDLGITDSSTYYSTGAQATIQSNQLRHTLGTVGGYGDYVGHHINTVSVDNFYAELDFIAYQTNESYQRFYWFDDRAGNSFHFQLTSFDYINIRKTTGYVESTLYTDTSFAADTNDVIKMKLWVNKGYHRLRAWNDTQGTEPTTATYEWEDQTLTEGKFMIFSLGGGAGTAMNLHYDNLLISVPDSTIGPAHVRGSRRGRIVRAT